MDYRRTRVEAFVVRNHHLLMVRERDEAGNAAWRLPGTALEEGETPEDGTERALVQETGLEGKVVDFLHRVKYKEGDYRMLLVQSCELLPTAEAMGYDPKDRGGSSGLYEVAWRSLRNDELREQFADILRKAHL